MKDGGTPRSRRELADRVHSIGRELSDLTKGEDLAVFADAINRVDELGQELRYLAMWLHSHERT